MNPPRINSVIQAPQAMLGVLGDGDFSRPTPPARPSGSPSPHVPGSEGEVPARAPGGQSGTPAPHVPGGEDVWVPAPRPSSGSGGGRPHMDFRVRVPQEAAAPLTAVVIIGIAAAVILFPEVVVVYGAARLLLMGASSMHSGDLNQVDNIPIA